MAPFNETSFAVIADIHSNSDALSAVLSDIADQNIDCIVNLGDHLSGPMAARETAELLLETPMISIKGNHDRWLTELRREQMGLIDAAALDQLDERHLDWARALPPSAQLTDEVFACHGTPTSDTTYWTEKVTAEGHIILRPQAEIEAEADGINASLFSVATPNFLAVWIFPMERLSSTLAASGAPATRTTNPFRMLCRLAHLQPLMPLSRRPPKVGAARSDTYPMIQPG